MSEVGDFLDQSVCEGETMAPKTVLTEPHLENKQRSWEALLLQKSPLTQASYRPHIKKFIQESQYWVDDYFMRLEKSD